MVRLALEDYSFVKLSTWETEQVPIQQNLSLIIITDGPQFLSYLDPWNYSEYLNNEHLINRNIWITETSE